MNLHFINHDHIYLHLANSSPYALETGLLSRQTERGHDGGPLAVPAALGEA